MFSTIKQIIGKDRTSLTDVHAAQEALLYKWEREFPDIIDILRVDAAGLVVDQFSRVFSVFEQQCKLKSFPLATWLIRLLYRASFI